MNKLDEQYFELVKDILTNGVEKDSRAGKVLSVFGKQIRVNLKDGLPILTTKKMFSKGCIAELLWFLKGNTNIKELVDNDVHIWDDDAYRFYMERVNKHNFTCQYFHEHFSKNTPILYSEIEPDTKEVFIQKVKDGEKIFLNDKPYYFDVAKYNYVYGDLGPVYGKQWRAYGSPQIDQITNLIKTLKENPDDRRMICLSYNPSVIDLMALPPCHVMFQFYTRELPNGKRELSCMWTQRSVDVMLGLPFNILSYALLTHLFAQVVGMEVGELIGSLGDCHIYLNQLEGVNEQLSRDPHRFNLPQLVLNKEIKDLFKFTMDDIHIENYQSYDKIKFPLSVG